MRSIVVLLILVSFPMHAMESSRSDSASASGHRHHRRRHTPRSHGRSHRSPRSDGKGKKKDTDHIYALAPAAPGGGASAAEPSDQEFSPGGAVSSSLQSSPARAASYQYAVEVARLRIEIQQLREERGADQAYISQLEVRISDLESNRIEDAGHIHTALVRIAQLCARDRAQHGEIAALWGFLSDHAADYDEIDVFHDDDEQYR